MGEAQQPFFEPEFNRSIKVQGGDDRLTSDAGVLLLRDADHRLGLVESLASQLHDPRDLDQVRYQLPELCERPSRPFLTCLLGWRAGLNSDSLTGGS